MNTLVLSALAASACITLASDNWGYGFGDFGHGDHGHDHDHSYDKGYTKGFDHKGFGEYGSHKYGGWGSYAKGEEHGSRYGSDLNTTTITATEDMAMNITAAVSTMVTAQPTMMGMATTSLDTARRLDIMEASDITNYLNQSHKRAP
ncbi:hypothetical protein OSTOST_26153 [Ostertagia ostertagi]